MRRKKFVERLLVEQLNGKEIKVEMFREKLTVSIVGQRIDGLLFELWTSFAHDCVLMIDDYTLTLTNTALHSTARTNRPFWILPVS